jgi:hypothetical protein
VNGMVRKFDKRYEGVRGTPFFSEKWQKGSVTMKNGKKIDKLDLKIDLFNHDVIMKRPNGDSIIIFAHTVDQVSLDDLNDGSVHVFKKSGSFKEAGPKDAFVEVLYEGKYTLLAERKKTIVKASYTGAYNTGKPYDEFKDEIAYYLKKQDKNPIKIKLSRKSVLDELENHQGELKSFISKENIDFKNEMDVVKVLTYYDSL